MTRAVILALCILSFASAQGSSLASGSEPHQSNDILVRRAEQTISSSTPGNSQEAGAA